jgi:hypothetical protein
MVDVEKTLYDNQEPFLDYLNDFLRQKKKTFTEEDRFQASDIEGWGFEGVYEDFADLQGWENDEQKRFMDGYEEWPGFHEAIDMIWTGELDYEIPVMEEGLKDELTRLEGLEAVDEFVIGTSRGNFFSDYDVESAVEQRLEEDFGIQRGRVLFLLGKSGSADIYIDDNPEMDLGPDERQLAIRAEYNDHLPGENLVDSFSEAVDRFSGKAAR